MVAAAEVDIYLRALGPSVIIEWRKNDIDFGVRHKALITPGNRVRYGSGSIVVHTKEKFIEPKADLGSKPGCRPELLLGIPGETVFFDERIGRRA